MASLALISLIGHVANPEELKTLQNDTKVLRFSLAVNVGWGDKKKVNWYRCSLFGKQAESLCQYITKGKPIMVIGEHSNSEYTTKDGKDRWSNEVRVNQVVLLGGDGKPNPAKSEGSEDQQSLPQDPEQGYLPSNDIPF